MMIISEPFLCVFADLDVKDIQPVITAREEVRVWRRGEQREMQRSGARLQD